ncbi:lipid A biosynthesis lauroyl acyltransferase [Magnetospira thiophila]
MTLKKYLLQPLEAATVWLLWHGMRLLPLDPMAALLGAAARRIGPMMPLSRRAEDNLRAAFPHMAPPEIAAIIADMWENLGRTAAEHPHLDKMNMYDGGPHPRVEVIGAENIDMVRDDGLPGLFFSGHLANWEVISIAVAQRGVPLDLVYRAANNPHLDWLYKKGRVAVGGQLIPKGSKGARQLLKALKDGRHVGMLVDQKMNDGIAVPFFGRDAMTASALAELALKYKCPIIPARTERLHGSHFRCTFFPPLPIVDSGDRAADLRTIMTEVNGLLESWIRERPAQWLWLHNRWPRD